MSEDEKKQLTAAQYRARAEAYRKKLKEQWRIFLETGALVVAAFVTLVVISMAWFVMNSYVDSGLPSISADGRTAFYLATRQEDQQGVYDQTDSAQGESLLERALKHFNRIDHAVQTDTEITFAGLPNLHVGTSTLEASDGKTYILAEADGVSLMVNQTSNLKNKENEDFIGPGSFGELTFYIIPAMSGLSDVNLTMTLSAYKLVNTAYSSTDNSLTETATLIDADESNDVLRAMMCGHLLLFESKDDNGDYQGRIEPSLGSDGSICFRLTESRTDWTVNTPVEVTIYWAWPCYFEDIIYTGQHESLFSTESDEYNALIAWMNSNRNLIVNTNEITDPSSLEAIDDDMTNAGIYEWSHGYNKGDQLIGDGVAYIIWTIGTDGE